ncbi:Acyl-CoA synthetase (AMP-forming)/AMP-acid ligase II [Pseudonocardia thermophila]|jgi:Acyl-CoA synthetases (AMP-forming)/AMP-acid ligases II|uniref:Acyl-CoA synthetase (AMP-forming)/AMP-acid ligase II n=1 Tax=Pseudonocardia thermophila TaxID=1848 RepID=A0A1M6Q9Y8_PSETH|nr:long-chain-fatty-acid--CoA ligase [Pseudonocardia thermophila]SHK17062.1 Acyl-CoA synthetase (AMP-forming)/AMP-acid ligase II [Pseudonocardia thermophila]
MTDQTDFASIVADIARERPDDIALTYYDRSWTWAQFVERIQRNAAAQRAAGLQPGDRVAVLDLNHPSCLETTLACAQVGTANAIVNFRLAPPEIIYVINDAQAKILFVGPEFAGAVAQIREKIPTVQTVVHVGGENDEYEAWLAAHEPDPEHYPARPDDCFVQLYTSGTTGFPKGALLTHRGMLSHARNVATDFELGPESRVQVAMPLFHVGGTSYALLTLAQGARISMLRVPDPVAVWDMLERERITHTFLVPALLATMMQVPDAEERDVSALQALSYGASPMPLPVLRQCLKVFPGKMHQVYGMTEACGVVSSLGPEDHDESPEKAHRLLSAGKPIHGVEMEVRDPATGEPVPVGSPGEIWVRTEQLMAGYWQKPDATESAITPDGWLRSGDGGYMDADGYFYVTDRIKDMIISGGENIYPAEIERVLVEHPTVADVAVIGVPDDKWGEVPKAIVVPAPGQTVDPDELIAYSREHLASFKCPKSVEIIDELPRNPSGKVLKKDLRAKYWEGRERQVV